jgi:hypothetical protein
MNNTNILISHESRGQGVTGASDCEAQLTLLASQNTRYLTNLMSEVASLATLKSAFKSVKRNKGAPGIDNVSVNEVSQNLDDILEQLRSDLLDG